MAKERRIVQFMGNVQGVGFRYAACRTAAGHAVTGTVRNLPDGSVECVLEGEPAEIDAFLLDLGGRMIDYIIAEAQRTVAYTGEFSGFGVAF